MILQGRSINHQPLSTRQHLRCFSPLSLTMILLCGCGTKSPGTAQPAAIDLSIPGPAVSEPSAKDQPRPSLENSAVTQLKQRAGQCVAGGQPAAAIEALSQAIALTPDDAQLFQMRAKVYAIAGENANAQADYSSAIRLAPSDASLHHARGYFLMSLGFTGDALKDFEKALQLDPAMSTAANNRGLIHLQTQDFSSAEADFERALKIDPRYVDALNNRGFARMKQGHLDQALADFSEALRQKPDYTAAWNNTGLCNLQKQDFPAALTAFNEAVRLAPNDVRWLGHRRAVLQKLGRFQEATEDAQRIQWLRSLNELTTEALAQPNDALAWRHRATHLMTGTEYEAAVADYSRAIKLQPNDSESLTGRATAHLRTGDFQNAVHDCNRSLGLQESAEARSIRGEALLAMGKLDQSIEDFVAARRFDDTVVEAYTQRAQNYEKQGRMDLAKEDRNRVAEITAALSGNLKRKAGGSPPPFPEP